MLWAVEGLLGRVSKRIFAYSIAARNNIAQSVQVDCYRLPEETLVYLRPSPGRALVETVRASTLAGTASFLREHYDADRRNWRDAQARQAWGELVETEEKINAATPDYFKLLREINEDWGELANFDSVTR